MVSRERVARNSRTNRSTLAELADGAAGFEELSCDEFDEYNLIRIRFAVGVAVVVEAIPRRLGREASGLALAIDKRIARRVANTYRLKWAALDRGNVPDLTSRETRAAYAKTATIAERRVGATVRWPVWLREQHTSVSVLVANAAALGIARSRPKWGVRRAAGLLEEKAALEAIAAEAVRRTK